MGTVECLQQSRFDTDAQVSQVFVELTQIALLFHAVCQPQNKQSFREKQLSWHFEPYFAESMTQLLESCFQCHLGNSFEQLKQESYTHPD
ncbi:Uncharacterised protein [Acinetobacter baumannii]|nr:Uncharacterised protein [Acinetobacter baumannii]SSU69254.1 Uncharacterised protein [Acinetobacter baumannii]SVK02889.1 Uncharacterised protein [Acinetobacter baumannii]